MSLEEVPGSDTHKYAMSFTHENGTSFDITPGITSFVQGLADVAYQDLVDYLNAWPKLDTVNPIYAVKTSSHAYQITTTPPPE
jgi:hypothetical protein